VLHVSQITTQHNQKIRRRTPSNSIKWDQSSSLGI